MGVFDVFSCNKGQVKARILSKIDIRVVRLVLAIAFLLHSFFASLVKTLAV